MSSQSISPVDRSAILAGVKTISGRYIEDERRMRRMTQTQLAARVGIGERWLREIEAGSPKSRIDDHMRCGHALGLTSAHVFIPTLFLEHGRPVPRWLLSVDLYEVGERIIDLIMREGRGAVG